MRSVHWQAMKKETAEGAENTEDWEDRRRGHRGDILESDRLFFSLCPLRSLRFSLLTRKSSGYEFGFSGAAVADDGEADVGGFGGEKGQHVFFTADTEAVAVESGA
jgi:hypothetical protein